MGDKVNIRIVKNGGSLSELDLTLIKDTDILIKMMRNRILVVADSKQSDIDWDLLMARAQGFYHIRPIERDNMVFQVWFERENDLNQFEKQLMLEKLATA